MCIRDSSKKLSERKRELLYDEIMEKALAVGIGMASPARIDEINILQATYEAMRAAIEEVEKKLGTKPEVLLNDAVTIPEVSIRQMPIVKGDAKSVSIADVYKRQVQERAIGQDVMNGLNPGQMVIKIVNEELVKLMGSETTEIKLQPGSAVTVIMMAGLQGAGKTTTTAKLAGKYKLKGDVYKRQI